MIDLLFRLLEKLTELARHRSSTRSNQFQALVAPIFEDLKVVHQDYLRLFQQAARDLQDGVAISQAAATLMQDRLNREALRRSIIAMADSFAEDKSLGAFTGFFHEVRRYFWATELRPNSTPSNVLLARIKKSALEERRGEFALEWDDADAREEVGGMIAGALASVREGWVAVSEVYAKAAARSPG